MTGLSQLRDDLRRPDLTADDAIWLLENVDAVPSISQAARFRYLPELSSMAQSLIAEIQRTSRGRVAFRLKRWLVLAKALLAEREESA